MDIDNLLKSLPVHSFEDGIVWFTIDSFLKQMKSNRVDGDDIRMNQKIDSFCNKNQYIKMKDNIKLISMQGLVAFCFDKQARHSVCKRIAGEAMHYLNKIVLNHTTSAPTKPVKTTASLYSKISAFDFNMRGVFWTYMIENVSINDNQLIFADLTLKNDPSLDWHKISFFEWHFQLFSSTIQGTNMNADEDAVLARKYEYLSYLSSVNESSIKLKAQSQCVIKRRSDRRIKGDIQNGIRVLVGDQEHITSLIEETATDCLIRYFRTDKIPNILKIVDCVPSCVGLHNSGLHMSVGITEEQKALVSYDTLAKEIAEAIWMHHKCKIQDMIFVPITCMKLGGSLESRYSITDHKIVAKCEVLRHFEGPFPTAITHENLTCSSCKPLIESKETLYFGSFDLALEYFLEVPLGYQIHASTFLNDISINRSRCKDPFDYLRKFVLREYTEFDSQLNSLNKNHSGVLQDLCGLECLVSDRTVKRVFSITQPFGVTPSVDSVRDSWSKEATFEQAMYDYVHKRVMLTYNGSDGQIKQRLINLLDCEIISMFDNLAKFQHKRDPKRSDGRTHQLCTLQGTNIGIPKDSFRLKSYHTHPECDLSENCACFHPRDLTGLSLEDVLLNFNEEEEDVYKRFVSLSTFGLSPLYKVLNKNSDFLAMVEASNQRRLNKHNELTINDIGLSETESVTDNEYGNESDNESLVSSLHNISDTDDGSANESSELGDVSEEEMPDSQRESGESDNEMAENEVVSDSRHDEMTASKNGNRRNDILEIDDAIPNIELVGEPIQNVVNNRNDAEQCGFERFIPPAFVKRHTPPREGFDHESKNTKAFIEMMEGIFPDLDIRKILFATDQKICENHIDLQNDGSITDKSIRGLCLLHIIKNACGSTANAYRECGLVEILKYLRDAENVEDLSKLLEMHRIHDASCLMKRLYLTLQLSFEIEFAFSLDSEAEQAAFFQDMEHSNIEQLELKWGPKFKKFLSDGSQANKTFALHSEMLVRTREVYAMCFSEKIGGSDGYNLLFACLKSRLLFLYSNGAAYYSWLTTQFLIDKMTSPVYYEALKKDFLSIPYGKYKTSNISLDGFREEEHRTASKLFPKGAPMEVVLKYMNRLNYMEEVFDKREEIMGSAKEPPNEKPLWRIAPDIEHVIPTSLLIIRKRALCTEPDDTPRNVYLDSKPEISLAVFDADSQASSKYFLLKRLQEKGFFDITPEILATQKLEVKRTCPKGLAKVTLTGSKNTVQRFRVKPPPSQQEVEDKKKLNKDNKEKKILNQKQSDYNACQMVVQPSGKKYSISKAETIPSAILALASASSVVKPSGDSQKAVLEQLSKTKPTQIKTKPLVDSNIFLPKTSVIPLNAATKISMVCTEMAGLAHKLPPSLQTGKEALSYVEKRYVTNVIRHYPNVRMFVSCDEKPVYTPKILKGPTRELRKKSSNSQHPISQLYTKSEIISDTKLSKKAIQSSSSTDNHVSEYVIKNIHSSSLKFDGTLIFDSGLKHNKCTCGKSLEFCDCIDVGAIPIECIFNRDGLVSKRDMTEISQNRGEAELSIFDWANESRNILEEGEGVLLIVSSGDIDAVVAGILMTSWQWPRDKDRKFLHPMYVKLDKKASSSDIYCITGLLELVESHFKDEPYIGVVISCILCMAGSDFVPKFMQTTHLTLLKHVMAQDTWRRGLFQIRNSDIHLGISVDESVYFDVLKALKCPMQGTYDPHRLSYDDVRQLTIRSSSNLQRITDIVLSINDSSDSDSAEMSTDLQESEAFRKIVDLSGEHNTYDMMLPPKPVVLELIRILELNCNYYGSVGRHMSVYPSESRSCIYYDEKRKRYMYNFGADAKFDSVSSNLTTPPLTLINILKDALRPNRKRKRLNTSKSSSAKRQLRSNTK